MRKFPSFVARAGLVLVAIGCAATVATAQDAPTARAAATWSHDRSGLTLPATLAGFTRGDSKQYDDDGYNVGVTFRDNASGSWADLFIYRAAPASVAVWGDRAAVGMFANPMLGDVDLNAVRIARFTPPGGAGENSGLRIVTPTGGDLTSSGLAIYLHDGWLVKLRMSSRTLDVTTLEARISEFVAAINLPAARTPATPFFEIEDCPAPLKSGKKAKMSKLDMMGSIMLGGTLGVVHDKRRTEEEAGGATAKPDPIWCRDPASQPQYGIYRRTGSDDSYLIALGDTGTSLAVGSYDLGPLMKPSRGYLVTLSDGVTDNIFPPFDRIPLPEQVLGLPGSVAPVFTAGLLPDNKGTTISVPSK